MIVRLGSENRVKIRATEEAFRLFFAEVRVVPVRVESGVSDHPTSLREIARGARHRARSAKGVADFHVGLEAGIFRNAVLGRDPYLVTLAWITDGKNSSFGGSPFFPLEEPGAIRKAGESGVIGALTRKKVTREAVTRDAVVMALAPWGDRTRRGRSRK